MTEDQLQDIILQKLEAELGATNVHKAAGSTEFGADIVFITKDFFGNNLVIALQLKVPKKGKNDVGTTEIKVATGQAIIALGHAFMVGPGNQQKTPEIVYIVNYGKYGQAALEYLNAAKQMIPNLKWLNKDEIDPFIAGVITTKDITEGHQDE